MRLKRKGETVEIPDLRMIVAHGDEIEVDEKIGKQLIKQGGWKEVKSVKPKPKPNKKSSSGG